MFLTFVFSRVTPYTFCIIIIIIGVCFPIDGGKVGGGSVVISIYSCLLSKATTLHKMNENKFKCHKSSNDDVQIKRKKKKQSDRGNGWKNRTRTNNHYYYNNEARMR